MIYPWTKPTRHLAYDPESIWERNDGEASEDLGTVHVQRENLFHNLLRDAVLKLLIWLRTRRLCRRLIDKTSVLYQPQSGEAILPRRSFVLVPRAQGYAISGFLRSNENSPNPGCLLCKDFLSEDKTKWRWTQSAPNCSPGKFPLTGKNTGNFRALRIHRWWVSPVFTGRFAQFPFPRSKANREFFRPYQGIFRHRTGNSNA
jgi:hypothetical protein